MDVLIIFLGLIIHVNQRGLVNSAVLPVGDYHVAEMRIPADKIQQEDYARWCAETRNGDCVIKLKGYNVTVGNARGLFSSMSDRLLGALPPLTALAPNCGRVRQEVRNRMPGNDEFASYIDYRGGKRTLRSTFEKKTHFPQSARPWFADRCVACEVDYRADVEGDYVILSFTRHDGGTGYELRLPKPVTIYVTNIDPDRVNRPHARNHFHYYYRIFRNQNCRQPLPDLNVKEHCDPPICTYSNPFPQADCTQTGHP